MNTLPIAHHHKVLLPKGLRTIPSTIVRCLGLFDP